MSNQMIFAKHSISSSIAQPMSSVAEHQACQRSLQAAIAIVDPSSILRAFGRMDVAPRVNVGVAIRKGRTVVGVGIPTGKCWHDFVKDDPSRLAGIQSIDPLTVFGGGFPSTLDGHMMDAIGVAGGYHSKDEECARAGLWTLEKR